MKLKDLPKELPKDMTYGECYNPLSKIEDKETAEAYFNLLVDRLVRHYGYTRKRAEEIEHHNIGYWTGYLSDESAARVMKLFDEEHPIFGSTRPSPEKAFGMGKKFGSQRRK